MKNKVWERVKITIGCGIMAYILFMALQYIYPLGIIGQIINKYVTDYTIERILGGITIDLLNFVLTSIFIFAIGGLIYNIYCLFIKDYK